MKTVIIQEEVNVKFRSLVCSLTEKIDLEGKAQNFRELISVRYNCVSLEHDIISLLEDYVRGMCAILDADRKIVDTSSSIPFTLTQDDQLTNNFLKNMYYAVIDKSCRNDSELDFENSSEINTEIKEFVDTLCSVYPSVKEEFLEEKIIEFTDSFKTINGEDMDKLRIEIKSTLVASNIQNDEKINRIEKLLEKYTNLVVFGEEFEKSQIEKLVKKVTEITDDDKIRFEKAIKELTIEISKRFSTDNINWDDEIKAVVGKCEREEDEEGKMLKIQERLSKLNEEVIKLVEKWMDTMSPITLLNEKIDSLIKIKGEKKKEGFEKESKEICMKVRARDLYDHLGQEVENLVRELSNYEKYDSFLKYKLEQRGILYGWDCNKEFVNKGQWEALIVFVKDVISKNSGNSVYLDSENFSEAFDIFFTKNRFGGSRQQLRDTIVACVERSEIFDVMFRESIYSFVYTFVKKCIDEPSEGDEINLVGLSEAWVGYNPGDEIINELRTGVEGLVEKYKDGSSFETGLYDIIQKKFIERQNGNLDKNEVDEEILKFFDESSAKSLRDTFLEGNVAKLFDSILSGGIGRKINSWKKARDMRNIQELIREMAEKEDEEDLTSLIKEKIDTLECVRQLKNEYFDMAARLITNIQNSNSSYDYYALIKLFGESTHLGGGEVILSNRCEFGDKGFARRKLLIDGITGLCRRWFNHDDKTMRPLFRKYYVKRNEESGVNDIKIDYTGKTGGLQTFILLRSLHCS